jgi:hypothetical protein
MRGGVGEAQAGPGGKAAKASSFFCLPLSVLFSYLLRLLGRALVVLQEAGQLERVVLGQEGGGDLERRERERFFR